MYYLQRTQKSDRKKVPVSPFSIKRFNHQAELNIQGCNMEMGFRAYAPHLGVIPKYITS